jgi:hypothetical protein
MLHVLAMYCKLQAECRAGMKLHLTIYGRKGLLPFIQDILYLKRMFNDKNEHQ